MPKPTKRTLSATFNSLRRLFLILPFVAPLTVLACAILAMRGVSGALPVLCVVGIVSLATRIVIAHRELRLGGRKGLGVTELSGSLTRALAETIRWGMDPDQAIECALAFGIGVTMARWGWTPEQIRDFTYQTAQGAARLRKEL